MNVRWTWIQNEFLACQFFLLFAECMLWINTRDRRIWDRSLRCRILLEQERVCCYWKGQARAVLQMLMWNDLGAHKCVAVKTSRRVSVVHVFFPSKYHSFVKFCFCSCKHPSCCKKIVVWSMFFHLPILRVGCQIFVLLECGGRCPKGGREIKLGHQVPGSYELAKTVHMLSKTITTGWLLYYAQALGSSSVRFPKHYFVSRNDLTIGRNP